MASSSNAISAESQESPIVVLRQVRGPDGKLYEIVAQYQGHHPVNLKDSFAKVQGVQLIADQILQGKDPCNTQVIYNRSKGGVVLRKRLNDMVTDTHLSDGKIFEAAYHICNRIAPRSLEASQSHTGKLCSKLMGPDPCLEGVFRVLLNFIRVLWSLCCDFCVWIKNFRCPSEISFEERMEVLKEKRTEVLKHQIAHLDLGNPVEDMEKLREYKTLLFSIVEKQSELFQSNSENREKQICLGEIRELIRKIGCFFENEPNFCRITPESCKVVEMIEVRQIYLREWLGNPMDDSSSSIDSSSQRSDSVESKDLVSRFSVESNNSIADLHGIPPYAPYIG